MNEHVESKPAGEEPETPEPDNGEVPDECPQIEACEELMTSEEYEGMCDTKAWIYCDKIHKENLMKYKKKPKDWRDRRDK